MLKEKYPRLFILALISGVRKLTCCQRIYIAAECTLLSLRDLEKLEKESYTKKKKNDSIETALNHPLKAFFLMTTSVSGCVVDKVKEKAENAGIIFVYGISYSYN